MKVQKVIDNYCNLIYKVDSPYINPKETRYFITISPGISGVLYLRKPSKLLGQIVGSAMKRGTVLYVCDNKVIPLTWENWKQMWKILFTPQIRDKNPVPNQIRPYRSKMFNTMQQERLPQKTQKRGFERTFIADKSMNLLAPPLLKSIQ